MIGPAMVVRRASRPRPWALRLSLGLLAFLAAISIGAPLITSADPTFESAAGLTALGEPLDAGAEGHPLGTDPKGRDLLTQLIESGLTRAQLSEALTHLGFYAGWSKAAKAITAVSRTLAK